jgi:hypothetical protein
MTYAKLRAINVNAQTEKKGNLTYLSWTWAVDELLQADETATWDFPEPKYYGETMMVFCNVTAFGKTMKMQLPVMDNRNNAIANPDARKISDATMRCLAKCIACFGIGLYIYAGSDLPQIDVNEYVAELTACTTLAELQETYLRIVPMFKTDAESLAVITRTKDLMKAKLGKDAK